LVAVEDIFGSVVLEVRPTIGLQLEITASRFLYAASVLDSSRVVIPCLVMIDELSGPFLVLEFFDSELTTSGVDTRSKEK
jgi:hypothetical protein